MTLDKAQLLADLKAARKQGLLPMVVRIGKGDGTTIDAFADTGESYTVWARTETDNDPLVVYFTPGKVTYAELSTNLQFEVERNDRNQLELTRLYTGVRDSLAGAPLPTNAYDWIHTHGSDIEAGQLNASLIFDGGQVLLEYGGTESDLSATGAGHLVQATTGAALSVIKDNFGASVAPTINDDSGDGYAVGSWWFDTTADNVYVAIDVSVGAALWRKLDNATVGGGWTDDGTVARLTTSTDSVAIGTNTNNSAKLYILEDDPDEIPLRIKAAAAQAFPVLYVEDNSGNIFFNIGATGQVSVNPSETAGGAFIANGTSGTTLLFADASANITYIGGAFVFNEAGDNTDARFEGDNDANLLFLDASTDRVGIGDSTPDGRFAVVGRADEVQAIIRGNGTQTSNILEIQDSASNAQVSVSGLGATVFNEEGNDADSRFEGDNDANLLFLDASTDRVGIGTNAPTAFLHTKASTTAAASIRLPAGTAPTSPNEGDGYNDSTIKATGLFTAGVWQYAPGRIFTATANAGPSNTTAETSIVGSGIGTVTLPANFFTAGKVYEFDADGMYSTDGTSRDIQIRIKLGSTTIGDATLTSTANTANGGRTFRIRYRIRCVTTGATGTMQGQGMVWGQLVQQGFNTNGTVVVDTTGTLAAAATADFATSNADCHFTSNILTVRAIN